MRKLRPLEVLTLGLTYKGRSPALASAQPPTPPPSQLSHGANGLKMLLGLHLSNRINSQGFTLKGSLPSCRVSRDEDSPGNSRPSFSKKLYWKEC